ncbi:9894_t:CDS:2 [Paraglomus occultum]|uniref:9894_t:CDS:1 n=1 Tax=Paraglomus occultum TaxID=144539 RepID=A0A9N9GKR9_9GLOM|nr:9894_t:CDS:2 [Paraglomus occultum]
MLFLTPRPSSKCLHSLIRPIIFFCDRFHLVEDNADDADRQHAIFEIYNLTRESVVVYRTLESLFSATASVIVLKSRMVRDRRQEYDDKQYIRHEARIKFSFDVSVISREVLIDTLRTNLIVGNLTVNGFDDWIPCDRQSYNVLIDPLIPDEFLSRVKRKEKHLRTFADAFDIKLLSQTINDVFKGNQTAAFDCLFPGPKFTVERDSEQPPVVAFSIKKYWFEEDVCNPLIEAINTLIEDRKAVIIDDEIFDAFPLLVFRMVHVIQALHHLHFSYWQLANMNPMIMAFVPRKHYQVKDITDTLERLEKAVRNVSLDRSEVQLQDLSTEAHKLAQFSKEAAERLEAERIRWSKFYKPANYGLSGVAWTSIATFPFQAYYTWKNDRESFLKIFRGAEGVVTTVFFTLIFFLGISVQASIDNFDMAIKTHAEAIPVHTRASMGLLAFEQCLHQISNVSHIRVLVDDNEFKHRKFLLSSLFTQLANASLGLKNKLNEL